MSPAGKDGPGDAPATTPEVRALEITAALRALYPAAKLRCRANPDGTAAVRIPGVRVTGYEWITAGGGQFAVVTLARTEHAKPADPRTSAGVPAYTTAKQVTGEWPASRQVTGLITLAIEAGCRPHIGPQRSPYGRRYRINCGT